MNNENGFDNQIPTMTPPTEEPTPVDVPIAVDTPAVEPAPVETPIPTVDAEPAPVEIPVAPVDAPVEAPVAPEVPVEAPVEAPVAPEVPVEAPVMPEPVVAPDMATVEPAPVDAAPVAPVTEEPVTPPLPGTTFGAENVAPMPAAPAGDGQAKKGLGGKLPIIVGALALIAIAAVIFFFKDSLFGGKKTKYSTPKEFYTAKVEETLKTLNANNANEAHYKMDIKVDVSSFKPFELNLEEYYNLSDKVIYLVGNGKFDSKQILEKGVTLYVKDKDAYAHLGSLLDKYIKFNIDDTMSSVETPVENVELSKMEENLRKMENAMLRAYTNSLKDEYFQKPETTDGTVVFVFSMNAAQMNQFAKDVITNLSKDAEFTAAYKELTGEEFNISEMTDDEFDADSKSKILISTTLKDNNVTKFNVELTVDEGNGFYVNGEQVKEGEFTFKVNMKQNGQDAELATGSIKSTKTTATIELNVTNLAKVTLNVEQVTGKFTAPDVSGAVTMEELSDEDAQKLMENISNNEVIKEIMEAMGMNNSTPTYDDDYDYNYDNDYNYNYDDDDTDYNFDDEDDQSGEVVPEF